LLSKISKLESDLLKEKEFVAKLQNDIAEFEQRKSQTE
jgi:hypothetical protein